MVGAVCLLAGSLTRQTMSRPRSCVGPGGTSHKTGNTVVSRGRGNLRAKSAGGSLKAKEEEYRRRNEELEAKTASLVREAEDIMVRNAIP